MIKSPIFSKEKQADQIIDISCKSLKDSVECPLRMNSIYESCSLVFNWRLVAGFLIIFDDMSCVHHVPTRKEKRTRTRMKIVRRSTLPAPGIAARPLQDPALSCVILINLVHVIRTAEPSIVPVMDFFASQFSSFFLSFFCIETA